MSRVEINGEITIKKIENFSMGLDFVFTYTHMDLKKEKKS